MLRRLSPLSLCLLILCLISFDLFSAEIRGPVNSATAVQKKLIDLRLKPLSTYSFTDHIYLPKTSSLTREYWRVRHYHKTSWKGKLVNLTHKTFSQRTKRLEKDSYKEFDTLKAALPSIPEACFHLCTFKRKGWEYKHDNFHIFLEEIDDIPVSVEVVSNKPLAEVKAFMRTLGVKSFFKKSVPALVSEAQGL